MYEGVKLKKYRAKTVESDVSPSLFIKEMKIQLLDTEEAEEERLI